MGRLRRRAEGQRFRLPLGGTGNYPADRQAIEALEDMRPGAIKEARENRRYLKRVVRYLAGECGIRQFIDNGSGLPAQNNVHQVAQDARHLRIRWRGPETGLSQSFMPR